MSRFHKKTFYSLLILYAFVQCFVTVNFDIMSKVSNALGITLFAFFTSVIYIRRIKNGRFNGLLFIMPFYIIWAFLYSWFINGYRYEILFQGIKILTIVNFLFYIYLVKPPIEEMIKIVLTVNTFVYLSIILCFMLFKRFSYSSFYGGEEYFGFISNPHTLGLGLSSLCIFYIICFFLYKSKVYIICFSINMVLLYLFNVRTYMFAVALSITLMIVLSRKLSIISKMLILVTTGLFGFGLMSVLMQFSNSRLFNSSSAGINALSSGRTMFWGKIMEYSFDRPSIQILIGNGINSTKYIMEEILYWSIGAHNDIIQIIAEFGILGIIVFALIYTMFFKKVSFHKNYGYIIPLLCTQAASAVLNGSMYYTFSMIIFFTTVYIVHQFTVNEPNI